jgi:hypothetical protein
LPFSTCCITTTEVNSFETEAMSKMVSVRIGICWSAGNSVPLPSAYLTAWPVALRVTTLPLWPSSVTAPAYRGLTVPFGRVQPSTWVSAVSIGAGSRPAFTGLASRSNVDFGA